MVVTLLLFAVCAFVVYRFEIPRFPLFLGLTAMLTRLVIVLVFPTPAVSDFGVLLEASQSLLAGDKTYLDTSYFQLWAYQNGFVAFQSLLLGIWNSAVMLKLVNCLVSSATVVLVYLLARELTSERASRLAALVYCFFPFPLFYVTVLSNQFFASFLIYLGLYLLIADRIRLKAPIRYLIFAVLLSLANVLRPESIIPLFSVVLYLLLTLRKGNLKDTLIHLAILLGTYFVLNRLISWIFVITGLSPQGLTNNAPHWKFVLGFNHATHGGYAAGDTGYLTNPEAAWQVIKERVCVPPTQLLRLFLDKIRVFWDGSGLTWPLGCFLESGVTVFGRTFHIQDDFALWQGVSRYTAIALYSLVALGVFRLLRKKDWKPGILLFLNQIFVTFGVYLLIEVQPRYAYHVQISVAILAALGIHAIYDHFAKRKQEPKSEEGET